MKWFEGSIAEAIQTSQKKNSLFCVVILGGDEVSQVLETSLASPEVQQVITAEDVVCIRIASDSVDLQHFAMLYKNANAPSIFCITNQGVACQVIKERLEPGELKVKFDVAIQRHKDPSLIPRIPQVPPVQPQPNQAVASATPSVVTAATTPVVSGTATPAAVEDNPLESRIERAKRLAAAKQQKKAQEEAEEEKKREIERRQVGQKVAELKRWQEEQEMKKLAEERRKDKEQEAQLRQRLRDQIAQDRIDRQARVDMASGVKPVEPSTSHAPPSSSSTQRQTNFSGQARLQFRLPDGSSKNHSFDPDSTLGHVRQYLIDNVVPFRDFSIWVAFPRREFTSTDYGTSLRDLGLLPSSALLIMPVTSTSIVQNAGQAGQGLINLLTVLFGYMIYPVTFILALVQRALPLPQNNPNPNPTSTSNPRNINRMSPLAANAPGSSSSAGQQNPKKPDPGSSSSATEKQGGKKMGEKGTTEGNVHRLRTHESDSDDEQATWNGNSTQQM